MFLRHHRLESPMEEGGEGSPSGSEDNNDDNNNDNSPPTDEGALGQILDPKVADAKRPLVTVEDFISDFDAVDKEAVSRYAQKFANENGNIDVQKVMKSGFHLEHKFGGFTGAPDGYSIATPEGLSGDVDMTDPYLVEFMASAKELNMSQDAFEKIMDIHLRASIAPAVDVELLAKEIGPDFDSMRENMAGFFKSRLSGDEFKTMNNMITGADSFRAIYNIYKSSRPTKFDDAVRENFNQAELKDQMEAEHSATDDHGNPKMRDPIYADSWRKRWGPFIEKTDM